MQDFQEKIFQIKRDGARKLHVLSDFDRTLTKAYVNGKPVPSLISVLRDHEYLTPDYSKKARALSAHYSPIENDPSLSLDQKKNAMHEWWTKHFALLIASALTIHDIAHATASRHVELREGTEDFLRLLNAHNIPLIIMSASGLGVESVEGYLKSRHLLFDNTHIISNRFIWDASGKATAIREPIIHVMNKDETMIRDFPDVYAQVQNRKNVLLLGDKIEDLGMVTGFAFDNLLSIGFLNENVDVQKAEYEKHFDIVLTQDAPMTYANNLLKQII